MNANDRYLDREFPARKPKMGIAELKEQLKLAHDLIDQLRHDSVSGLIGRQTFEELLSATFGRVQRANYDGEGKGFGIVMCDIDHFKKVNDKHGHIVGDKVLAAVAGAIKGCTRSSDHAARWGGEEFVCLVGEASLTGLALLSERIRSAVEDLEHSEIDGKITVSVGFSLQRDEDKNPGDVVDRADHAMYGAKNAGRNRVGHSELGPDELQMIEDLDRCE
jgi:diguanylate cyclase (GGDEF)-like protein